MNVLTLKQPWAWAVFSAGKNVENRPYHTNYRGRLFIHAGLKVDVAAIQAMTMAGIELPPSFDAGVIIGSVEIYGCVEDSDSMWAQPGQSHWLIRDPQLLATPLPHRGYPFLHKRKDTA